MPAPYFFFTPLLAPSQAWAALQWESSEPEQTTVEDFLHCFASADALRLTYRMPLLLRTPPAWLGRSEFIQNFDANQAIFLLPETILDDNASLDDCRRLRLDGRHCALHAESAEGIRRLPPDAFDYLCLDAALVTGAGAATDSLKAQRPNLKLVAFNVPSHELFHQLACRGADLCNGQFVTATPVDDGKAPDLLRMKLLKLLTLVTQDAESREIEAIFREEPKLSYNLLRLVNSVAVGAKTTITSFHQAIAVLGRRQLQRWLQLLIYANQHGQDDSPNPLLQQAALRGRQMELLSQGLPPDANLANASDSFFMTGMFSLLDRVLRLPMQQVLATLPLQQAVADALLEQKGTLGRLLKAVVASETADFRGAAALLEDLGISPDHHAGAQIAALEWVNRIASAEA